MVKRRRSYLCWLALATRPYNYHFFSGNYKMNARTDALKGMLEKLSMSPQPFRAEYVYFAE